MAGWRRCDRCRRVLPGEEFDGASPTCRACVALPAAGTRTPRSGSPVTRSRTTPRTPARTPAPPEAAAPAGPRPALLGVTGSGDLEVRERRARRAALEQLVTSHPEEFALLLRDARLGEGLRPSGAAAAADTGPAADGDPQA